MLDPGFSQVTEMNTCVEHSHKENFLPPLKRKKTVKELLMQKHQKWNWSQEGDDMEYQAKCVNPETAGRGFGPCILSRDDFPPAYPESVHMIIQQMQRPALREEVTPTAEVKMSLFHWQIQVEARRVGEISPEMLNMQDPDGDTCLHIAVAQGRRALAYVFASEMARYGTLDMKEHNGQTALHIAAVTNQHLIVQDLLTFGAQINTCDSWGRSPLHVCAEKGHIFTLQTIWKITAERGQPLDIEQFNYDGLTPLHTAVLSHNAVVKELRCLENPHSFTAEGLMWRKQMFAECVQTLFLMGASLTTKDLKSGRTCLHMASEEANVELLQVILNQPLSLPSVNVKTFSGNTALHILCSLHSCRSQVEAVKLLMSNGADPGTRNFENDLPSQLVPEGVTGRKMRQILKGNTFKLK